MDTLIDTHAHIYLEDFQKDIEQVLDRAAEQGVYKIYMPNIDHTSIDNMMELEARYGSCIAMMGLHPCSVKKDFEKELYQVEEWLSKRNFAAVGEIGTDLYWDRSFWPQQQEAFRIQLQWAKEYKIPAVIHCRESIDETIDLVAEKKDESLGGVFHCFTGNEDQAKRITDLGFYLGIGGVSTFKNGGLDKVLPAIDLNHIVLETDSPYLAPVPYRGKRNEPAHLKLITQRVADLKKCTIEEVQEVTTKNALTLFNQPVNAL